MSSPEASQEYPCYFCPKAINEGSRYVEWEECYRTHAPRQGHRIRLHPKCAIMLGQRLIGDAFSADGKIDTSENVLHAVGSRIHLANLLSDKS